MKKSLPPFFRVMQIAACLLIFGAIFFLYRGFYHPDPYVLCRYAPFSTGLLWSLRIGIPLLVLYVIGLLWGYRTDRMSRANTVTLLGSLFLCGIVGLTVIHYKYKKTMIPIEELHPYLQLRPPYVPDTLGTGVHILCLGGSTTEFTDSQGRGWPDRVQEMLNNRLKRNDIYVYNLGRQWYTTQHSLIYYETSIRAIRPDAVLVMHTINDLLHNADFSYLSRGSFQRDYGHFDGPLHRLIRPKGCISLLWAMIRSMWYHTPRDTVYMSEFPGLASFRQNLNSLVDLAETDHVPVILMTQPNLYKAVLSEAELHTLYMLRFEAVGPEKQWHASTVRNGFQQYRHAIQSLAHERKTPWIDLESEIPKTLAYFKDDVHYTDKAFDMVAEVVTDGLIRYLDF
ncbi:SGNH/GDSL hydrolase family protein [bacterium]|nr:SGNH/GDSL hydrolase family protein [bacterium]